ncbi:MAG: serine/threonine protein kinase [Myxococcaceae bacterium]|nr:serine/threonine protein kinase [Myxococcaceae bacterium]
MAVSSSAEHLDEVTALELANGELALELREAAVAHLDACARCRQWVSVLGGEVTQTAAEPTLIRRPGELLEGQQIGEYEVVGRIAEGGMGAVYKARQPLLGKNVAIKVLLPHVAADPGLVDRLLIEAQAVNAIRHPNVIDVFSFGQTEWGQHYFVMEFLEGETLSQRLHAAGQLGPVEAIELLDQICAGLAAVHGAGVLHRDLKPGNIFLTPLSDGAVHVKLLDFGLAKRQQGKTSTQNVVMGTVGYMAPDQITGKPASPQSDLYSVGVIAFRMLTGRAPFSALSDIDLLVLHKEHDAPRVSAFWPEAPAALDNLVARLLDRDAAKRPTSAAEVRRELQRIGRELSRAETVVRAAVAPPTERVAAVAPKTVETPIVDVTPAELPLYAKLAIMLSLAALVVGVGYWLVRPPPLSSLPAEQPKPVANVVPAPPEPAPDEPEAPLAGEAQAPEAPPPAQPTQPPQKKNNVRRPVAPPTAESVKLRLRDARARTAKVEAQGMRRIVESELTRLEQQLTAGTAPAQVAAELNQVLKDYAVP